MKYKNLSIVFMLFVALFISCERDYKKKDLAEEDRKVYLKKGKEVAAQTFTALSGKLQSALKEGGVPGAIDYCHLNAIPIIDSLSKVHNAAIRRATLKARNKLDQATTQEKQILLDYEKQLSEKKTLAPLVEKNRTNNISFYAPIKVNAFCMQCHGKLGETITEENYNLIKEKYPNDKAIGYSDGDLRGMWRITFQD